MMPWAWWRRHGKVNECDQRRRHLPRLEESRTRCLWNKRRRRVKKSTIWRAILEVEAVEGCGGKSAKNREGCRRRQPQIPYVETYCCLAFAICICGSRRSWRSVEFFPRSALLKPVEIWFKDFSRFLT